MNKAKSKGSGVVAVAAVAAVVAAIYGINAGDPKDETTYKVDLRVDFEPKERIKLPKVDQGVQIVVTCDCTLVINDRAIHSPWTRTVEIPKSSKLVLTATQQINGTLSCSIFKIKQETRDFAGSVVRVHPRG